MSAFARYRCAGTPALDCTYLGEVPPDACPVHGTELHSEHVVKAVPPERAGWDHPTETNPPTS